MLKLPKTSNHKNNAQPQKTRSSIVLSSNIFQLCQNYSSQLVVLSSCNWEIQKESADSEVFAGKWHEKETHCELSADVVFNLSMSVRGTTAKNLHNVCVLHIQSPAGYDVFTETLNLQSQVKAGLHSREHEFKHVHRSHSIFSQSRMMKRLARMMVYAAGSTLRLSRSRFQTFGI